MHFLAVAQAVIIRVLVVVTCVEQGFQRADEAVTVTVSFRTPDMLAVGKPERDSVRNEASIGKDVLRVREEE